MGFLFEIFHLYDFLIRPAVWGSAARTSPVRARLSQFRWKRAGAPVLYTAEMHFSIAYGRNVAEALHGRLQKSPGSGFEKTPGKLRVPRRRLRATDKNLFFLQDYLLV